MTSKPSGRYELISTVGEKCKAFIPNPLPPTPPIQYDSQLLVLMHEADLALGRLDAVSTLLPDIGLFIFMYIRKEAILSSQIEGTQSSLSDLLLFELDEKPGVPLDDVMEVSNYITAMNIGLQRIREGMPVSVRLIRELHAALLAEGRGADKSPGEIRKSQNWIGGSRPGNALYVPPPVHYVADAIGNLEKYINDVYGKEPLLTKTAISHAQFETIHPFLDGNGRVGRLLITLLLCKQNALQEPLLYLSLYLKQNKDTYYELLQRIRTHGEWRNWIEFFLEGVRDTCSSAVDTARNLQRLFSTDRERIQQDSGRAAGSDLQVQEVFQKHPISTVRRVADITGLSDQTVYNSINRLHTLGIIEEMGSRKYAKLFTYFAYLDILKRGTDSL